MIHDRPTSDRTPPWYRWARRWGQTNITEADPPHYDIDFWREHWRRTRVQGVIINAGGIVAYYPSDFEEQYRAKFLGDRDLFGELTAAARDEGLAVLARMDSNRADANCFNKHPDWFARDREGNPIRAGDRYIACVNSPCYKSYLPDVLREIVHRYKPDGFTDNSWAGPGRRKICYCEHCTAGFASATGEAIPAAVDWTDPIYRQWVAWSYDCRLANWDLNNAVTRDAGGEHCLWLGMLNANPISSHVSFADLRLISERSKIIMCDHQSRDWLNGFEQNGLNGKLLHGLVGWDKLIPESMAMYARGERAFRVSANPPLEARMWMIEGMAGGISPWWHHISARHEDRRQYDTAEPVMRWHEENERYLYDREPLANVAMVWSQTNVDFYGRDHASERVALPWRGFGAAMLRGRIPFLPLHADQLDRMGDRFDVLILPDLAALSDDQVAAISRHIEAGGSIVATGRTGLLDAWGEPRPRAALAEAFGVEYAGRSHGPKSTDPGNWDRYESHNYLRLSPERFAAEPTATPPRHPVLNGFDLTDILPFGGTVEEVTPRKGTCALATLVPAFPIYPPEFAWMRQPRSDVPAILVREHPAGGRIVYFAADVDRRYAQGRLPDLGDLLANAVRWAASDRQPLRVEGTGGIDCHLYSQGKRLIVHLINLSGLNAWPGYAEQQFAVGPLRVSVSLANIQRPSKALLRVAGGEVDLTIEQNKAHFEIDRLDAHEMVVLE